MEELRTSDSTNLKGLHLEGGEDEVLTEISWMVKMKVNQLKVISLIVAI